MHDALNAKLDTGYHLIDQLKLDEAIDLSEVLVREHAGADEKARILNLKGEALLYAGHYPLASASFFDSLSLANTTETLTLADANTGLSYVYRFLEDYSAAIEYAQRARELLGNNTANRIYIKALLSEGISNARSARFTEADLLLKKALQQAMPLNDDLLTGTCIKSQADLLLHKKEYLPAIRLYEKALAYASKNEHYVLKIMILVRLAEAFENTGDANNALEKATAALEDAIARQFVAGERSAHLLLSGMFEKRSDTNKAFSHLRSYVQLSSGGQTSKQSQNIHRMELDFVKGSYEKERQLLHDIKQKHLTIQASIDYAKGLQDAILPRASSSDEKPLSYFVYFKPKEQVGGDFYWIDRHKDHFLFCVADCTGHGVPGAMLSMLSSNLVTEAARSYCDSGLNQVLSGINRSLHGIFGNANNILTANDGMDICLCAIQKVDANSEWVLKFSSANHTCIIIRGNEVLQLAHNRTGISALTPTGYNFSETEYPLKKGDHIYMFSDGYPDQFGGSDEATRIAGGKKFKYRQLIALLQQASAKTLPTQKELLHQTITAWKGQLEQVDDICVMGIAFNG